MRELRSGGWEEAATSYVFRFSCFKGMENATANDMRIDDDSRENFLALKKLIGLEMCAGVKFNEGNRQAFYLPPPSHRQCCLLKVFYE